MNSKHRFAAAVVTVLLASLPAAAQLFPSAKSANCRVGEPPAGQTVASFYQWVGQHFDLVPNCSQPQNVSLLRQANPGIKVFRYSFVNGLYEHFNDSTGPGNHYWGSFYDSFNYCARNGLKWEDWFLHYGNDIAVNPSGQKAANARLDQLRYVLAYSGGAYSDRRDQAYNTTAADVPFGRAVGDILYVGHPTIYAEINFNLYSPASGWAGVWEYWNGSGWAPLPVTDGTQAMSRSGKVSWWPVPSGWRQTTISGEGIAYWVRLRTTSAGSAAPVATTIRGEQFVQDYYDSTGTWKGILIPGWDPANDTNGDGIRDTDADPGATARFRWQARVVEMAPGTGVMYGTNLGNSTYRQWIIDHDLADDPSPWDGAMYDVVDGKWMYLGNPIGPVSLVEYPGDSSAQTDAWAQGIAAYLSYADTQYHPLGKLVGGNTSAGFRTDIDATLDFALRENWWNSNFSNWYFENRPGGFFDPTAFWRQAQTSGKLQLLQVQMLLKNSLGDYATVWNRDKLFALSTFYLGQNPATDYFNAWWGYYYGPNLAFYYVPAIEVDIGQPAPPPSAATTWIQGAYLFATGTDTTVADGLSKYRVYARNYTKGLVLVKPRSDRVTSVGTVGGLGDNTATTHQLPGLYYPVNADGTLGALTSQITLRNTEGAILVKANSSSLQLSTRADVQTAKPGQTINYSVTYTNSSGSAVYYAVVNVPIDSNLSFVAGSCRLNGVQISPDPIVSGKLAVSVGTVAAGATGTVTFQATVK